ncbi:MAG: hypothetical protein P0Y53_20525 [Candidatus Pseudobacter hemicellulosilyticus]|uniref:Uncharacterized protein n=1 Tax=Candidatus Pseudobacter hemicellulosilyticus TaxID=3121375 RepID=A0AAJ6BES3_9BACT|nr:MAG: hypothetical protein P0Y53_20525 [Pseudobacter sp.]
MPVIITARHLKNAGISRKEKLTVKVEKGLITVLTTKEHRRICAAERSRKAKQEKWCRENGCKIPYAHVHDNNIDNPIYECPWEWTEEQLEEFKDLIYE